MTIYYWSFHAIDDQSTYLDNESVEPKLIKKKLSQFKFADAAIANCCRRCDKLSRSIMQTKKQTEVEFLFTICKIVFFDAFCSRHISV